MAYCSVLLEFLFIFKLYNNLWAQLLQRGPPYNSPIYFISWAVTELVCFIFTRHRQLF